MRTKTLLVALTAVLALGALTACDPAGLPVPTPAGPTETSEPAPSDEPETPVTTAHHIRVSATLIGIMDESDIAYEAIHDGVTAEVAVPLLKTAFGFDPTITTDAGGMESGATTTYTWGGFELIVPENPASFPPYNTWIARVNTAAVAGIPIYAGTAIQVGDPMSEAIAEEFEHMDWGGPYVAHLNRNDVDPASVGEAAGSELYVFLGVYGDAGAGGDVTSIVSHQPNWGV